MECSIQERAVALQALSLLQEPSGGSLAEKAVEAAEALKARTEEAAERARESLRGAAGTAGVGAQLATGTSKSTVAAQQAKETAAEGRAQLSRPWRRTLRGSHACTATTRKPLKDLSRGRHSPPHRSLLLLPSFKWSGAMTCQALWSMSFTCHGCYFSLLTLGAKHGPLQRPQAISLAFL